MFGFNRGAVVEGPPNRLVSVRMLVYIAVMIASAVVLGIAADFASKFLPHIHRPFIIFALIVPSVTLIVFLVVLQTSTPGIDLLVLFLVDVLWLALAAFATDMIGNVECFPLGGLTVPTKNGSTSLQGYCYEMKTIEAFGWGCFGVLTIFFGLMLVLVNRHTAYYGGQYNTWGEPIRSLPWFGYGGGYGGGYPGYGGYPQQYGNGQQPYVVQQQPGHSLVIQTNPQTGQPIVQQVPGYVQSGV